MSEIAENLVDVDKLLKDLGDSCLSTARWVEFKCDLGPDGSTRYVVPEFKISVKLSFTKTGETVKGILFWKKTEGSSTEALSEIQMSIVAVPRAS